MISFNQQVSQTKKIADKTIYIFEVSTDNIDSVTVESFGEEWLKYSTFKKQEIRIAGDQYFDIVDEKVYSGKNVLDVGCGTGRWSKYVADKAAWVDAVDPSVAVISAAKLLAENDNVRISKAAVSNLPFPDHSYDLVFSLGVLHHIPDTMMAMDDCVKKVKYGGYFLVYLYYNLDNRGVIFKSLFYLSNILRRFISKFSPKLKRIICDVLAVVLYLPFVSLSKIFYFFGVRKLLHYIPLSYYRDKSFKIIRNDSLDRFGTPLEQRFSKSQIIEMMQKCGLTDIVVSDKEPFWHAIGKKS